MVTVKRKCFVVPCKTYGKSWIYKFLPEDTLYTGGDVECNDDELRDNIHVHILTNDDIKDGDWAMSIDPNSKLHKPFLCRDGEGFINPEFLNSSECKDIKKIVSSSDDTLTLYRGGFHMGTTLSSPSKSFIEKYITSYNNRNTIEEVMVDFEGEFYSGGTVFDKVKTNSKNNIIISKVKNDFSILDIKNALHQVELDDNKDYTKIWNKLKEKLEIM